jgi:anti-sigma factor RsiW
MSCERLHTFWETFLDGELPSRQMLDLQLHLDGCAECSEALALSQAIRVSERQVVYEAAPVTDDFRLRLSKALVAEAQQERAAQKSVRLRRLLGRASGYGMGALAVAAALLLWLRFESKAKQHAEQDAIVERERQAVVTLGPQELLDLFLDYHTAPPAPALTEPKLIPELERDVGVRVPLPILTAYGAEWQGGNLLKVPRTQPAAYLRYRTRDAHRLTVYVYNASRIPLHASLERRMIREEPVYERSWRGYSVAAQLRHGVGYAVATDLDETRSAELVRAITRSVVSH